MCKHKKTLLVSHLRPWCPVPPIISINGDNWNPVAASGAPLFTQFSSIQPYVRDTSCVKICVTSCVTSCATSCVLNKLCHKQKLTTGSFLGHLLTLHASDHLLSSAMHEIQPKNPHRFRSRKMRQRALAPASWRAL